MTSYKLYYFNARGRAESTRLLFAAAGVAYEDHRYEREEWGIAKPSMPFGQLPVLEVNGTKYGESAAINRYLAKKFNMMGKDDESALRIDSYAELLYGLIPKLPLFEKDPVKKAEDLAKVLTGTVKQVYSILEKQLCGKEYLVGEISLADIVFLYVTHILIALAPTVLGDYPNSASLLQRIEGLPKIAAWMKQRPITMM